MVDKICKIIFTLDSLANLFTVIGLPLTAYAIYYAKNAFKKQNEALELQKQDSDEQKILGAWSLLAQKGTGDLGRKDALEFLHSKGKSLVGLDLSNAHLVGLKLNGADLTGCNFTGANLNYAVFEGATLWGTHFEGAKLFDAHFEGATLWGTHFKGAQLWHARFEDASLWGTHFKGADLIDAHFKGAKLMNAHFEGMDLNGAHFKGAKDINPANFKNCYTSGSNELPTAPKGWKFEFEKKDGTQKTEVVDGLARYYIKLIKTETKNP